MPAGEVIILSRGAKAGCLRTLKNLRKRLKTPNERGKEGGEGNGDRLDWGGQCTKAPDLLAFGCGVHPTRNTRNAVVIQNAYPLAVETAEK